MPVAIMPGDCTAGGGCRFDGKIQKGQATEWGPLGRYHEGCRAPDERFRAEQHSHDIPRDTECAICGWVNQ